VRDLANRQAQGFDLLGYRALKPIRFDRGEVATPLRIRGGFGYTSSMATATNFRVLRRILEPVSSSLNDEAARKLIGLKADRKAQARVSALARKCNEGTLTADERDEYETYVMAGEFIAILHAKARLLLARREHSV